ncbi:MAG: hypothetical protein ACFFD2_22990 [Promethearchaeota archaeon]
MTHEVDISGIVPLYGQEEWNWCGAASAQMIMDGYPDPAFRIFIPQIDIWNSIQAHNSADPINQAWHTDPQGEEGCLMDLNPPPGGTWNVHMDTDRDEVMFDILYWMNKNSYPVAVCINAWAHWSVIVQYKTDIEPVSGSTPTLEEITIHDPLPEDNGTVNNMLGNIWFATLWADAVTVNGGGTWANNWVAVIEPPVVKGKVKVKVVERVGEKIISPEEAIESAKKWIKELGLAKKHSYRILQKPDIVNQTPLLIREQIRGKKVTDYYIVPFGLKKEEEYTRISIIINAYTGDFEEIGAFRKPLHYLTEKESIRIAAKALGLKRSEIRDVKARLMFQSSKLTHIRTYPFWEITIKTPERERVLYIDQIGKVHKMIEQPQPGD